MDDGVCGPLLLNAVSSKCISFPSFPTVSALDFNAAIFRINFPINLV